MSYYTKNIIKLNKVETINCIITARQAEERITAALKELEIINQSHLEGISKRKIAVIDVKTLRELLNGFILYDTRNKEN